jgi:hypothetical protein
MTSKFEQLIEYVINDEEAKAKELFHDIVVEKSREIYENLMNEEADECDTCHKAPCECDDEEAEELDETAMGGDASDELIDDIETEEQGMMEEEAEEFDDEAEEEGEDLTHDMEKDHDEGNETEHDIEDRVVDLEDKLDELMAEFEALMGDEKAEHSVSDIDGGDALEIDDTDTKEFDDESMMENVKLDAAPKPVTGEESFVYKKATYAANSGAKGMQGAPVKMTGDVAQGRTAPKTGDVPEAGKFKNVPGKGTSNAKLDAAPKPVTAQAAGVNTTTPFPRG